MAPYSKDDQIIPLAHLRRTETAPVHAPADMIQRLVGNGSSTCATGSAFRARGIRFRSVARGACIPVERVCELRHRSVLIVRLRFDFIPRRFQV
jgi:hypothetical protein